MMKTIFFYLNKNVFWLLPPLVFLILTPIISLLDQRMTHYFYLNQFSSNPFFDFIYRFGPLPALLTATLSLAFYLLSFKLKQLTCFKTPCLYLFLTLAIGSGLFVHLLLKDQWGRPRPKQVIEFGGNQTFKPYYAPNFFHQKEPAKSFPCGHGSTGFYFFSLIFLGKRLSCKKLTWLGYTLAFTLGGILSFVRIAQGGHFFSDTIVSALIMWESALFLDLLLFSKKCSDYKQKGAAL